MEQTLVIFDLDGTLVDSEQACNQAFLDLLPSIEESAEQLITRYRGKKLANILQDLEQRYKVVLPKEFEQQYRQRVTELFNSSLKPMPGVMEMLSLLSCTRCIASSGPPEKIRLALSLTSLDTYFGNNYFSSYTVNSWKPAPELFLHASASMGFQPNQCIVIEDSLPGIEAAAAAGMRCLQFVPASQDTEDTNVFSSMNKLPALIENIQLNR